MYRGYTRSWRKKYDSRSASRGLLYIGAMDWLVGNANWNDSWVDGELIRRGQIAVGRKQLSQIWKVSEQTVRTILHNLTTDGFLTTKSTNRGTVVTITNFDIYQPETTNDQPANQPVTNQRPTTIKEFKEGKEIKETHKEKAGESIFPFSEFWEVYGKKVDRMKCERIYARICETDRAIIKARLPRYIASTPDMKYRKNPQTYLNGRCWNDEIIGGAGESNQPTIQWGENERNDDLPF